VEHRSAPVGDRSAVLALHEASGGLAAAMVGRATVAACARGLTGVPAVEHPAAAIRHGSTLGAELSTSLCHARLGATAVGPTSTAHIGRGAHFAIERAATPVGKHPAVGILRFAGGFGAST